MIGNAISSARTLIESVEVFDKAYIDSDGTFKTYYISKAYDKMDGISDGGFSEKLYAAWTCSD